MRFGAEELFKDDKNEEESKKRLLSMDIDEILKRAEKVEDIQEALAPRGTRSMKSYVEPAQVDGGNKRKKKESTSVRVNAKRRRGVCIRRRW